MDLAPALGDRRGLFLLELRSGHTEDPHTPPRTLLQVTGLGLTLRSGPKAMLAWVTHLHSGEPVAGAEVNVRMVGSEEVLHAQTDANGVARFDLQSSQQEALVTARHGADTVTAWKHVNPTNARLEASQTGNWVGRLFSERGIYRPGQVVHLKAYVRRRGDHGLRPPESGQTVTVQLLGPHGDRIATQTAPLNAFGATHLQFELERDAALGYYQAQLLLDNVVLRTAHVHVAEYRAPSFEVSTTLHTSAPDTASALPRATAKVLGTYLFGAPMSGSEVRWSAHRWRHAVFTHDLGPYSFSNPFLPGYATQGWPRQGRQPLDAQGLLTIPLEPNPEESSSSPLHGPWTIEVDIDLQDTDRQVISDSARGLLHDRDAYLGVDVVHEGGRIARANTSFEVHVVGVDTQFKRIAGLRGVVRLLREEWHEVERRGAGGSYVVQSERVLTEEGRCSVVTVTDAERPAGCRLRPGRSGEYVVVVEGRDRGGRSLQAGSRLYVEGTGYVSWRPAEAEPGASVHVAKASEPQRTLELVPDRNQYSPGDQARVMVKSPWEHSWALVTVEHQRNISEHILELDGSARALEVPITKAMASQARVHVAVVRGRLGDQLDGRGYDRMAPQSRMGTVALNVSTYHRWLDVEVTPSTTQARPGDTVDVAVEVKDNDGVFADAEVTLWAVDEAVLQLSDHGSYRSWSPDTFGYDAHTSPWRFSGHDTRSDLVAHGRWGERFVQGGDGSLSEEPPSTRESAHVRRNFQTTPMYIGSLETGRDGLASAQMTLPDNLTRFRIMAVAVDRGERSGSEDTYVQVWRSFMVRPAPPRFLHQGDEVRLSA
ncbi:MAG: MG2 domain-containing protein, partial [Myxococcota bacterium]